MSTLRRLPVVSRLRLETAGVVFDDWTSAEVSRGITEIAGTFRLDYDDRVRTDAILGRAENSSDLGVLVPPEACKLYLDGELVLAGWIEELEYEVNGTEVRASISGRDRTGFLIECSANPEGPAEYKGLTVLEIATRLCLPFGIPVRAEVDVGAPLPSFGIDAGETVMSCIDKAAKQRGVLVTSDGVGGLVLTRSGFNRAPGPLTVPGNAASFAVKLSSRDRFSDYWVKGQARNSRGAAGGRRRPAALTAASSASTSRAAAEAGEPLGSTSAPAAPAPAAPAAGGAAGSSGGTTPPPATAAASDVAAMLGSGHAVDPGVVPYRPKVFVSRSQSGGAPNQVLAEWRMRIARGRSTRNTWMEPDWRAGPELRLWRPNEVVSFIGAGVKLNQDYLIVSVAYRYSDQDGARTALETTGREAYDLEPLGTQPHHHRAGRGSNVAQTGTRE